MQGWKANFKMRDRNALIIGDIMATQRYQILIPGICKCYLTGKGVFADTIKDLEVRVSSWVTEVGSKSMTTVLTRVRQGET